MHSNILAVAAISGALAVVCGALGAHALEVRLSADSLDSFNTAVRYQAWHAIALLFLALAPKELQGIATTAWLWGLGMILFSGSIYLLSTTSISGWKLSWLGPVTPVGGLLLIAGWLVLFINALRYPGG